MTKTTKVKRKSIANRTDLIGRRFNRLVVLSFNGINNLQKSTWLCKCDCGKYHITTRGGLISGITGSCGCYGRQRTSETSTIHGLCKPGKMTDEYIIHRAILTRCNNKSSPGYKRYGARGIKVCERWSGKNGVVNFVSDMGNRPSKQHSIDRIDTNGNYSPENCRWATPKEQAVNKRNNTLITVNGVTKTASQWAEIHKIRPHKIRWRIKKGWKVDELFIHDDMRHRNGGKSTKARKPTDKRLKANR